MGRAICYVGYASAVIQTDNGGEFTNTAKTNWLHAMDVLCARLNITHKRIRPRAPWHNGKVERSRRNDQERFYSLDGLRLQMERYLGRATRVPMAVLG